MLFSELGLHPGLLAAVAREGYTEPTPIQAQAIPQVLAGGDLLAAAQTGTGKTAAFTLPILHRLAQAPARAGKRLPRVLILVPTRELAAQVGESVVTYGGDLPLQSAVIFGGVNINPQIDKLRRGLDIIIATPGRLLDLLGQRATELSQVEVLVLDEADRMLDMGFIPDIKRILKLLPAKRQNLLFSATFSREIRDLAQGLLHAPKTIDIAPRNSAVESVDQKVIFAPKEHKSSLLSFMVGRGNWQQTLVFTRTKHGANRLCEKLIKDGLPSAALHGNKSQSARTKALADFKAGRIRVLVATDIAARGLDIDQLPHVVNFELPNVPEDYVHRIGRTGRAGASGEALSLVGPEERGLLKDIERMLKKSIPVFAVEGYDLTQKRAPEPDRPPMERQQRRGQPQRKAGPPKPGGQKPWHGAAGKPQKTAEWRMGKSRKVH
jgi:ATP-dependent RNA helicase RhlE